MAQPVPPNNVVGNVAKKSPSVAMGLFTLGSLATAAWMMKDSFTGSRDMADNRVANVKRRNDLAKAEYDWGRNSGQPGMDRLSGKFRDFMRYGPYNLRENFQVFKLRASTFFSNVVAPNLIPLGIGVAGLYGTFGAKTMHKPFKAVFGVIHKATLPAGLKRDLRRMLPKVGRSIGSGLGSILRWPFQSLGHLGVASGLAFFGSFFLKRFNDNYSGDTQRQFYRGDLFSSSQNDYL